MEFLELCKKVIEIESTPSTGNVEMAEFCAEICRRYGFQVTLQPGHLGGLKQFNLIARPLGSNASDELIFQSHLDTVEPGPLGNWTKTDHNPFSATVTGDFIYGLGTTDVKLDFLCKIRALKEFVKVPQKRPFVLVGTYGEEIGMHGAHQLMKEKAVSAKMAIIGEPSELQIVHANNGYMVVDFEIDFSPAEIEIRNNDAESARSQEKLFRGKAAHSSTPHLGDNAILKLVKYLENLPRGIAVLGATGGSSVNTIPAEAHVEIDGNATVKHSVGDRLVALSKGLQKLERDFLNFENKDFSPSHPTLNLGLLSTDDKGIRLSVSFRITPNVSRESTEGWVKYLEEVAAKEKVQMRRARLSPPAFTPLSADLVVGAVRIADQLGLKSKPITKASGTESSVYCDYGLDCIVFGPGVSIGNSHTANEYNLLSQLEKATLFYTEAVKRFCL